MFKATLVGRNNKNVKRCECIDTHLEFEKKALTENMMHLSSSSMKPSTP